MYGYDSMGRKLTPEERRNVVDRQIAEANGKAKPISMPVKITRPDGSLMSRAERNAVYDNYGKTVKEIQTAQQEKAAAEAELRSPYAGRRDELRYDLEHGDWRGKTPAQIQSRLAMAEEADRNWHAQRVANEREAARQERIANDPASQNRQEFIEELRSNPGNRYSDGETAQATRLSLLVGAEGMESEFDATREKLRSDSFARIQQAHDVAKAKREQDWTEYRDKLHSQGIDLDELTGPPPTTQPTTEVSP